MNPPVSPISYKRYVDDTHCRFTDDKTATDFLNILNLQEYKVQFTMEKENSEKESNFLDVTIKNTCDGEFLFKIFRKQAITNVQIKPSSSIPSSVKDGVFKGFLARAYSICSPQHLSEEIEFLKNIFIENGYNENHLKKIITSYQPRQLSRHKNELQTQRDNPDRPLHASLPWIPGVSDKLKKLFKSANINTTFKSSSNLNDILCRKNKARLPTFSTPGVYMISCSCGKRYVGESGGTIKTRIKQHQKACFLEKSSDSDLAEHNATCDGQIQWEETKVLSREDHYFKRCIRESLEIRKQEVKPGSKNGLNKDNGKYLDTNSWEVILKTLGRE